MGIRALFVASPMVGHVLPLVPLASAFRDAGHDIVFATAGDGVEAARGVGVAVQDVAPVLNVQRTFLRALLPHPLRLRRILAGEDGTSSLGYTFAPLAERMADRTVALVDDWRPDLVLHEGLAPLGALVAARLGVPSVLVDALLFDGRKLFAAVLPRLGGLARRYRVDAIPQPADAVVAIPPSPVGGRPGGPSGTCPRREGPTETRVSRPPARGPSCWSAGPRWPTPGPTR